jgi:hypothetical protein
MRQGCTCVTFILSVAAIGLLYTAAFFKGLLCMLFLLLPPPLQGKSSEELRGSPYLLSLAEITRRTAEAWDRGATEVCLQG